MALLRSVNVGARGIVRMAELREMLADVGAIDPKTLLQSGNTVFGFCGRATIAALESGLETEAQRRFGRDITFIVRTLGVPGTARNWNTVHRPATAAPALA